MFIFSSGQAKDSCHPVPDQITTVGNLVPRSPTAKGKGKQSEIWVRDSTVGVLNLARPLTVLYKIKLGIKRKTKDQEKILLGLEPLPHGRQVHNHRIVGQKHIADASQIFLYNDLSSYFKAVGPNRFHFLFKILQQSKCIAKRTFLAAFYSVHNFSRTRIVGFLCKFTELQHHDIATAFP